MWNQYHYDFDLQNFGLVGPVQQKIKLPSPYILSEYAVFEFCDVEF